MEPLSVAAKGPGGVRRLGWASKLMAVVLLLGTWGVANSGCGRPPSDFHTAYAEIVAEEDARGRIGLARIRGHLESADPAVRALATRALGRMEEPGHVGLIKEMLLDGDPSVRVVAAAAVAQAVYGKDPEAAIRALSEPIARESDPVVLASLATNLGRLPFRTPEQREAIAGGLEAVAGRLPEPIGDPGLAVRLGLARGIEAFARGSRRVDPESGLLSSGLVSAASTLAGLTHPDQEQTTARIRRLATAALVHTDQLGAEDAVRSFRDLDWGVRRHVVIAALRHGIAYADVVLSGLDDPDFRVRLEALSAYDRWIRPGEGCGPIFRALGDPNPHVSARAIDLAARLCPERETQRSALQRKVAQADDPAAGWHGPVRALFALAGIAPDAVAEKIVRFKAHPSPFVRAWTAGTATRAADEATLRELAADPDPNVREAAIRGLGSLVGSDAREVYLGQLKDEDPQLVMTATRLLVEFAPGQTSAAALLAPLGRFTSTKRETVRDVRAVLLDGIGAVGGYSREDITPYVTDFDPVVAERATALLEAIGGPGAQPDPSPLPPTPTPDATRLEALDRSVVRLRMAGLGDIVIALRPRLAATNADRFARLAQEGYFDGLTFHRVEPNFVIQGGSPNANEYAGDGRYSRDEISGHPHWRGTVGLSTRGRDTGDAQIFINLADNVRLDFNYTIYGEVLEGMEVVDAVQEGAVIESARVERR